MRTGRASGRARHAKSGPRRWVTRVAVAGGVLVLLGGIAVLLVLLLGRPTVSVSASSSGVLNVRLGGLGTRLDDVQAKSGDRELALVRTAGGLVPATDVAQGETVQVTATASAPSWLRWLVGSKVSVSKTLITPSASPSATIALASSPGHVPIDFTHPVTLVDYRVDDGPLTILRLRRPALVASLVVPARKAAGSLQVVAAPLTWEEVGRFPTNISWFVPPASGAPVALVDPAPGSATATTDGPITMIFDEPVSKLFVGSRPDLSPKVSGTWSQPDSNTLIFTPSGFGFGPGAAVTVSFKQPIATISTAAADATTAATTSEHYTFEVAQGSILRMEQILAQLHYLPLDFVPAAGVTEPTNFQGEVATISTPLPGKLSWRWFSTPEALQRQWSPGAPNAMLKGALMSFLADQENNSYDGYQIEDETVGQLVNASLWDELLHAAASDQADPNPYSYVYVSENLPETLTLWENGSVVLTAAGQHRHTRGSHSARHVPHLRALHQQLDERYQSGRFEVPRQGLLDQLLQRQRCSPRVFSSLLRVPTESGLRRAADRDRTDCVRVSVHRRPRHSRCIKSVGHFSTQSSLPWPGPPYFSSCSSL